MRVSYFGYCLRHQATGKRFLLDLKPFLSSFCSSAPIPLKNRILQGQEHLYLFHQTGNLFLLIKTRSNEIIKRINTQRLDIGEIYDVMSKEDTLGFVSYVYFWDHCFGFASTLLAPRATSLSYLVDQTINSFGVKGYEFITEAFIHQASRAEILRLPFLGKTVIEISKQNSFFENIANIVTVSGDDFTDVGSFEVVIKPKRKKNIDRAIRKFITKVNDEGLKKFIIRAKEEIDGQLTDLYLAGMGTISDSIDRKDISGIGEAFKSRILDNVLLQEKIQEFNDNDKYEKVVMDDLLRLRDPNSWTSSLQGL